MPSLSDRNVADPTTEPFWRACLERKLVVQKCTSCGVHQFYPRPFCLACESDRVEWVEASGQGVVYSVTTVRIPVIDELPPPYILRALAGLDMAGLIARIDDHVRDVLVPRMRTVSPHSGIEREEPVTFPGLDVALDHPAVTFMKHLLGRNDHSKVAFGTEAGLFSATAGIVSLVCGPGSIEQAHKPDEFLAVSEVEKCQKFLKRLVAALERDELPW